MASGIISGARRSSRGGSSIAVVVVVVVVLLRMWGAMSMWFVYLCVLLCIRVCMCVCMFGCASAVSFEFRLRCWFCKLATVFVSVKGD